MLQAFKVAKSTETKRGNYTVTLTTGSPARTHKGIPLAGNQKTYYMFVEKEFETNEIELDLDDWIVDEKDTKFVGKDGKDVSFTMKVLRPKTAAEAAREGLFRKYFLEPVKKLQESGKIDNPKEWSNFYRKKWLQQGRQDFDNPNIFEFKLSKQELIDLYCYYYLQMHYSSSSLVFNNGTKALLELCSPKNIVHFIDYGCGPGTSGIAFNHWLQDNVDGNKNVRYYGIDRSLNMCMKAEKLLKEPDFFGEYSMFDVPGKPNGLIERSQPKKLYECIERFSILDSKELSTAIIFNFCYLFASESLDVDELSLEINNIIDVATKKTKPKVVMIYQNPEGWSFDQKWNEFKQKITNFKSVKNYPKVHNFTYSNMPDFKVSTDILTNY